MSNVDYVVYKLETGEICESGGMPQEYIEHQELEPGTAAILGKGMHNTHYVPQGKVMDRPANTIVPDRTSLPADGVEEVVFSNVEDYSEVIIVDVDTLEEIARATTTTTGQLKLTFSNYGDFRVRILHFPTTDYEVIINAY